jgi:hypothetical protein
MAYCSFVACIFTAAVAKSRQLCLGTGEGVEFTYFGCANIMTEARDPRSCETTEVGLKVHILVRLLCNMPLGQFSTAIGGICSCLYDTSAGC